MDINKLKSFKTKSIVIYGCITLIGILIAVIGIFIKNYYLLISFFPASIFFILFVVSFNLNYKEYKVDDNIIICYAGWERHYLIINGEVVDEYISAFAFTPIDLKYKDDLHEYELRISTSNNFTLKVDGKLIR